MNARRIVTYNYKRQMLSRESTAIERLKRNKFCTFSATRMK